MKTMTMPVSQVEKLVRVLMAMKGQAIIANYQDHDPAKATEIYRMIGRVMAENGLSNFRGL